LFAGGKERGRELIEALLAVFAQKGAIAFPEPLTARDILRFGPHTADAYTFHRTQSGRDGGRQVTRWNPYLAPKQSRKNAIKKVAISVCSLAHLNSIDLRRRKR